MPNEVISAWDNLTSYFPDKEVEVVADVLSKSHPEDRTKWIPTNIGV